MTAARGPDGRGHQLGLGLDFGSTGLRAAFGRPGDPVRRFTLSGPGWPWLLCEPSVTGPLPVTFRSLKSRLGSGRPALVGGVPTAPEEVVTGLLRTVRERAEAEAGGRVTQTVVSVPVSYDSGQRTALLEAARAAGLAPVRLIGDAMAAVIGHTGGRVSTTCLVYGLGYGGFELGLVRGARERYRALGHESASTTGGRAFDEAALTGMLRAARRRAVPDRLDAADWLRLRARVERIREELSASGGQDDGLLELDLGGGIPAQLRFDRAVLDEYLERHVRRTLDRARTLLDQSGMDRRDVDTLLLVGGGTGLEAVRSGVRGLGHELVRAPDGLLATGAFRHASQLAGAPPSALESLESLAVEPPDSSDDTLAEAPRLSVTLLSPRRTPSPAAEAEESSTPSDQGVPLDVGLARRLAEHGRVKEARALLETILSEARTLLDSLEASPAPPAPAGPAAAEAAPPAEVPLPDPAAPGATAAAGGSAEPGEAEHWADLKAVRRLTLARDLLAERRFEEAVQTSHAAWQAAGDGASGADVLDAMIAVHCAAAMADSSPEHFPDAERWLRCAYGHDPTNATVRQCLAERTYRHAERLETRGRREDAVEALEQCLTWNPEHAPARELLERISRRGRNHRDRGGVPR